MPRNGAGQYTLPSGINPVITQTLITSNWANTTLNDVAAALTQSVARDGQTVMTGALNMGGNFVRNMAGGIQGGDATNVIQVQTGALTRLNGVSGTNAITASLISNAQAFNVGQLVQLIPAFTNTGPVTLNINGSGVRPVLSAAGNPLGPTNLIQGQVYILSFNGTSWNILSSPDQAAFAQAAISGWFRPGVSAPYPDVTMVNANTIAIPAGSGRIIRPSTRDITGVTEVSWLAQNFVLTNIATQWQTTIGIDATGQVVQFSGNVNPAWARTNIILATVGHINGAIQFISNKPLIFGDVAYMAYDIGIMFHNRLIKGGRVTGNLGNPLHLDIAAGRLWVVGGAADNVDSPNFLDFPQNANATFWPVSTTLVQASTQTVPVGFYDQAGAGPIIAIPGGGATSVIHRLYLLAGQLVFSYGQFTYANLDDAVASIGRDDTIFTPPVKLVDATFVSWIVARKDATDLNNPAQARLISAAAGGASAGGGGGSGVPEAPLTGQTFGRNNGIWVLAVDAVQAGSNIAVDATNPNKPVVNMPSGNLVAGTGITFGGTATNRLVGAVGNLSISALSQGDGDLVAGVGTVLTGTLADRLVGPGNVTFTGTESFRNKLINGNFDVWQRATSLPAAAGNRYCADRWKNAASLSTMQPTRQPFLVGSTETSSHSRFYQSTIVVANGGASSFARLLQSIDGVRSTEGRPCVLSFYARANAPKFMTFEAAQSFGSGGSAAVVGIGATKVALTTAFQKFVVPFNMPSIAGKTIGSDATDQVEINFWMDDGGNQAARTLNLGPQSGTFDIAQVQLEFGSVATEFEVLPIQVELELCQRFCQVNSYVSFQTINMGQVASATAANMFWPIPVTFRGAVTATITGSLQLSNNGNFINVINITNIVGYPNQIAFNANVAGGLTNGPAMLLTNPGTSLFVFESEF